MKKILICSNALLLCICLLLGFLLIESNNQLRQVQAQSVNTPTTITPASSPTSALTPTPETTEDLVFKPVFPNGSIPLPFFKGNYSIIVTESFEDLEKSNPIDDFFEPYWALAFSTIEENTMMSDYKDAWKAEVLHAYDLLAQLANPNAEFLLKELQEAKEALLDFAMKDGILYASVFCSDGYDVTSHYNEMPMFGTALPGVSAMAQASHYREYTIYLHLVLYYHDVEADFIFDPEPLKESWAYLME